MIDFLIEKMSDTRLLAMLFAAVAAMATVITLAMPLLAGDNLGRRMKAVALEREKIRQRERERLMAGQKVSLRRSPKQYMQTAVDRFNLAKWVGQEEAREKLVQAGYRGQAPYVAFLFFRAIMPVACFVLAIFYLFVISPWQPPLLIRLALAILATVPFSLSGGALVPGSTSTCRVFKARCRPRSVSSSVRSASRRASMRASRLYSDCR